MKSIDSSNINEVNSGYSFIDHYADWCGPCKMLSPIFEKISNMNEYSNVKFYKNDTDKYSSLAEAHGVQSIPTLIFLSEGKEVFRLIGAVPEKTIRSELDAFLAPKV